MIASRLKRVFLHHGACHFISRNALRFLALESDGIDVQDRDAVRLIVLNRPSKRNALSTTVGDQILASLRQVDSSPGLKVTILTGSGKASVPIPLNSNSWSRSSVLELIWKR